MLSGGVNELDLAVRLSVWLSLRTGSQTITTVLDSGEVKIGYFIEGIGQEPATILGNRINFPDGTDFEFLMGF